MTGLIPLFAFLCLIHGHAAAQEEDLAAESALPQQNASLHSEAQVNEPPLEEASALPEVMDFYSLARPKHLAAALSDPAARNQILMTLIAVERLVEYGVSAGFGDIADLEARFRDERAWLDRLASRHQGLSGRGSELDPAAWFVLLELDQHKMVPGPSVSPLGPEEKNLVRQLFDRSDVRMAATVLPEVLQRVEMRSMTLWRGVLQAVSVNDTLLAVISGLNSDWFNPWIGVESPMVVESGAREESIGVIDQAFTALNSLAGSTMLPGPTDSLGLKQLRFTLLSELIWLDEVGLKDAQYLLMLASAIDGLNERKYLSFTETLLWVISDLLLTEQINAASLAAEFQASALSELQAEQEFGLMAMLEPLPEPEMDPDTELPLATESEEIAKTEVAAESRIPRLLSGLLPRLSNVFAGEFSVVDPRINASLAAVYDSAQYLQGGSSDPDRLIALRRGIGDSIAQFVLLLPEMEYYFDQPVRRRIADEINVCTSIAANVNRQGVENLSREQFDGCLASLAEMSESLISKEELAGDPDGPFGSDQLQRELMMPPWQRINFSLGFLHERFPTGCSLPDEPLPNPLEWSSLATMIAWFARQSPVYFQTPENEALVTKMRQQGLNITQTMSQQLDCVSGTGSGINDPVARSMVDYHLALDDLVAGIREFELEYREEKLKPGADVVLHSDATQRTAYRPEELSIKPCDPAQICEMSGELEATRVLIGQFPDSYLIADQTGLGSIEICYRNMEWVNRRAVPVRPDDPHVANYFGRLSFDLVGRYVEKGELTEVFGSKFVSPEEYHYLFAPATEEVREDSCPTEWVGTKIVTGLNQPEKIRVVPDRLTYLASARETPSAVINANWSRGEEWRDWFATDQGVKPYEFASDAGIEGRVNQHLQTIYQAGQSALYSALLRPGQQDGDKSQSLFELQEELTARKALVRSFINLFYPQFMLDTDEIRGGLEGYDALLDTAVLRRFREANVAVASINETGLARLDRFQAEWGRQSDAVRRSGSIATSVAHAIIRLNALYLDFFVLPAEDQNAANENYDETGL